MKIKTEFLSLLKEDENVLYIYEYGESVYKLDNPNIKFIVVTTDKYTPPDEYYLKDSYEYKFYTIEKWFKMVLNNSIEFWECSCLSKPFIYKQDVVIPIVPDYIALRKEILKICSDTFEKTSFVDMKDIWNCIRIIMFGIQIIKFGRIIDYSEANQYYSSIVLNSDEKNSMTNGNIIYNNLLNEFKNITSCI